MISSKDERFGFSHFLVLVVHCETAKKAENPPRKAAKPPKNETAKTETIRRFGKFPTAKLQPESNRSSLVSRYITSLFILLY